MKKLPIGISDFKEIIEEHYYYADKSLLIDEIETTNSKVLLITRPRRFGKTLNLSMLKYFFEKSETSNQYLFHDTLIWQNPTYHDLQGNYPVIFLTFKSVKSRIWKDAYEHLTALIREEFMRHSAQLLPTLSAQEAINYNLILKGKANATAYANSLLFLSRILHKLHKKRVFVLIDEYDTPIYAAYNYGYYDEMIEFIRGLADYYS